MEATAAFTADLVVDIGRALGLSIACCERAQLLAHQYLLACDDASFDADVMAAAAIFASGKLEALPKPLDQVCVAMWAVKNERLGRVQACLRLDGDLAAELRVRTLQAERAMLRTSKFELRRPPELPSVQLAAKLAAAGATAAVARASTAAVRAVMRSPKSVALPATQLAEACLRHGLTGGTLAGATSSSSSSTTSDRVCQQAVAAAISSLDGDHDSGVLWASERAVCGGCIATEGEDRCPACLKDATASWPRRLSWMPSKEEATARRASLERAEFAAVTARGATK